MQPPDPTVFREWIFVGAPLTPNALNDGKANFPEYHHVYIEKKNVAKINAQGQWIDRSETVNLNELFDRMTRDELEAYAKDGVLPDWFKQVVVGTESYSPNGETSEE